MGILTPSGGKIKISIVNLLDNHLPDHIRAVLSDASMWKFFWIFLLFSLIEVLFISFEI